MSQNITFLPGQFTAIFNIQILDDIILYEPNIYFWVDVIFNRITIAQSTITIVDNDYGKLAIVCVWI